MRFRITLFSLILLVPSFLLSGSITHTFHFSREGYSFSKYNGYDVLTMRNGVSNTEVSKPSIPFMIANFVIPAIAEVTEVTVISKETEELSGVYDICPVQTPRPFSSNEYVPFVEPDPEIYNLSNEFPEKDIVIFPSGSMSGYRIAGIYVNPVKYIPNEKRLIITTELTVCISYSEGTNEAISLTSKQRDIFGRGVRSIVLNKDDIKRFSPPVKRDPPRACEYVIITSSGLADDWQKLADWKIAVGYSAQVFTTDWIYANYTGYYDNQESIRSFLTDYFTNNGLIYAVLGGDVEIVPERDVYTLFQPPPNWIAADYYYSDLDGDWDGDGDHKYGELNDGVDGYFDIYVGRPPVDDAMDVNSFLMKDSVYIFCPPAAYTQKLLLPSELLWSSPYYHGHEVNNEIGDMFPTWTVTKLEDGAAYPPNTRNAFNENYNLMHISAHGNTGGTSVFTSSDVPHLTNTMPTIMNSIACYSGNFDGADCFAEELMNKSGGAGCVAVAMNSRYGYGTPPSMGPSEKLDTTFFSVMLKDTLHIGMTHAAVKGHYRNVIWTSGLWHFCGTELNLFGDPEMVVRLTPTTEPYIDITDKVIDDNNSNGTWEPGEYAEITVTLSNGGGASATNVQAVLRATSNGQYVTVSDSTSSFGNIAAASSADNASDPYKITADPVAPSGTAIEFTVHITCDEGFSCDPSFTLTVATPYYNHDIGNVRFTVTNRGICGFMDESHTDGSGFKYPITGNQHLFIGSIWVGCNPSYVVNRDYSAENAGDWQSVEGVIGNGVVYSDQDSWAKYDDAGMTSPKNLTCEQYGWAWSDPGHEDYVIMKYTFTNEGASAINGLFFGQFMDWNVGGLTDNSGGVDHSRNLIYQYGSGTSYVGIGLLEPTTVRNITFINNATYVSPNSYILDSDKIKFLMGALSSDTASSLEDWSTCVSVGPFVIQPWEFLTFAVVVLGGENLSDVQENCDSAEARYWSAGVAKEPEFLTEPTSFNLSRIFPQPFSSVVNIEYSVQRESVISLNIFDVSGRLVKTIMNKRQSSGVYRVKWDGKMNNGKRAVSGVYFCSFVVNDNEHMVTRKLLLMK